MTEANSNFGEWLKKARRRKKLSQTALSEHIDALPGEISWWESGKSEPTEDQRAQVVEFLGTETRSSGKRVEKAEDRDKNRPTRARLTYLYHEEGKSLRAIAAEVGTTAWHVRRWMDEYGIERRSQRLAVSLARKREREEAERRRAASGDGTASAKRPVARGKRGSKKVRPASDARNTRTRAAKSTASEAKTATSKSKSKTKKSKPKSKSGKGSKSSGERSGSADGDEPQPAPRPAKNTVRVRRRKGSRKVEPEAASEPLEEAVEPDATDADPAAADSAADEPREKRGKPTSNRRNPQVRVLDLRDEIFGDRDELERRVLGKKGAVRQAVSQRNARSSRRGEHPALRGRSASSAPPAAPAPVVPASAPTQKSAEPAAKENATTDLHAISQQHRDRGYSVPELAGLHGMSAESVVEILSADGIKRRSWRSTVKPSEKPPPRDELAELLETHQTPLGLARALDVSLAWANAWLERRHLLPETGTHVERFQRIESDEAAVVAIADDVRVVVDTEVALDMADFVWELDDAGHVVTRIGNFDVPLTHLVLGIEPGEFEGTEIAHRNGNVLDLRESNLVAK